MLRPVRTTLLAFAAFILGVFYERSAQTDRCLDAGGRIVAGLCESDQR